MYIVVRQHRLSTPRLMITVSRATFNVFRICLTTSLPIVTNLCIFARIVESATCHLRLFTQVYPFYPHPTPAAHNAALYNQPERKGLLRDRGLCTSFFVDSE